MVHRVNKIPNRKMTIMAGAGLDANRFHRYVIRNIQEDKNFKGSIIRSSLIEV